VLYNVNAWNNIASGKWKRSGNGAAIDAQILATSSPLFPSGGNVYSSQSASQWALPTYFDELVNPPNPPAYIFAPVAAVPAAGTDGPMAIFQPDGTVFESYATIRLGSGQIVAMQYHIVDSRGDGSGYANGTTASMLPVFAGVIRNSDLANGLIDHAMKIIVPAALLSPAYVMPALAFDRNPSYSGHLPMGARLAIPPTVNLKSLGLTTPVGKMIAAAAQAFGFIVADQGGGANTIMVEAGATSNGVNLYDPRVNRDIQMIMSVVETVE
jgi:hypothetical protein